MTVRTKTFLMLLGTLLVGAAVGALGMGAVREARQDRLHHLRTPEGLVRRMEDVVGPGGSDPQEIRAVFSRYAVRIDTLYHRFWRERSAVYDSMRQEVTPLLDPAQRARLEAWHRESKHKGRRSGPSR